MPRQLRPDPAGALRAALGAALPQGWTLRNRTEADADFLAALFASTREDEMRHVPWSGADKAAFLRQQFDLQHAHYLAHYPRALWLVIESPQGPAGRLYVEPTAAEIRLMEITLAPAMRGRGIGGTLVRALVAHADTVHLPVGLHVEPFNPAVRLYERLGFAVREQRGAYQFMVREPRPLAASGTGIN